MTISKESTGRDARPDFGVEPLVPTRPSDPPQGKATRSACSTRLSHRYAGPKQGVVLRVEWAVSVRQVNLLPLVGRGLGRGS